METNPKTLVTITATVNVSAAKAWLVWNAPEHIVNWNFASDDWHCPAAKSDLRAGGTFTATMAAKDGTMSFEFGGVYDVVIPEKQLGYTMGDGRKVMVVFESSGDRTIITESFEAESEHPVEFQKAGWQAILNNYVKYAESVK